MVKKWFSPNYERKNIHTHSYRKRSRNNNLLFNFSVVTWLIIITSLVSLISFILFAVNPSTIDYLALKPSNIAQGQNLWTLLTHMFIHGNVLHLFVNMFVLFSLGKLCEKIIGRKRFIWFYIAAGLCAALLSVVVSIAFGNTELGERIVGNPITPMVGASGAIFGIAGLYVMLLPKLRFMIIFLPFFSLPAYIMVPLALGIMWLISVVFSFPFGNVAHLGGFLAGILYGLFLRIKYRKKVQKLQKYFR